jgi:hypothetical protein
MDNPIAIEKPQRSSGRQQIQSILENSPQLSWHPQAKSLIEIITGETDISSAGFPYVSERSFRLLAEHIPHLFTNRLRLLRWLHELDGELQTIDKIPDDDADSIKRAIKVVRQVVNTAGVTAPPDLWIVRQVLSAHKQLGTLDWLLSGHSIDPEEFAEKYNLSEKQLQTDLHLLYARGLLRLGDANFLAPRRPEIRQILENVTPIPELHRINWVSRLTAYFQGNLGDDDVAMLAAWLDVRTTDQTTGCWIASLHEIELGYRITPFVLSLRVMEWTDGLKRGVEVTQAIPQLLHEMKILLERAGYTQAGVVTDLGERVFLRGPGPFGIIGAYHEYLNNLMPLLQNKDVGTWVSRGENVAASQDANRDTFLSANDRLDQFCAEYSYQYKLFIEHAVGRGEATRQRFERSGEATIQYFGADLEDAAIDQAIEQQKQGVLPSNMQFIRNADIGVPERVTEFLHAEGLLGEPTVMMVGNGFHEIRQQTDEKMIEVFRKYHEAGFTLIFTEATALHDEALRHTAWNTSHSGFRYVHEISGQGLRPSWDEGNPLARWSWRKCATEGGYIVLDKFTDRSRRIYPYPRSDEKNPAISVTYFCIPQSLATRLNIQ